ncbi:hypothetical protein [Actibacterium sp. 188UL27-1]|uniref:hypothetical protein n=1 Tax=Actibacterium sp. 188UL27-1 TaxID=2786961 RepID=UPI001EF45395|nr:hypothetical protein [Actibacterium sp. 188UL27-1]
MAVLRVLLIAGIFLTVVYVILSLYARATCRSRLARTWDAEQGPGDRDTFIAEGLEEYDQSLRKKLLLGVYVVPVVTVATIMYLTNYA